MGATFGAINFEYDLHWVTKFQGNPVAQDKAALDGSKVTVRLSTVPRGVHTFKFTWITHDQLEVLKSYAENCHTFYALTPEEGGASYSARFVADQGRLAYQQVVDCNGFTHISVEDTTHDLYDGEMHLILSGTSGGGGGGGPFGV